MLNALESKMEKLQQIIERLVKESNRGVIILVEGQNDVNALHKLEVQGSIISVKTHRRNLLDVISEIECKRANQGIILLLDFDRRGIELVRRIKECLEERRIKVNINYWKEIRGLVRRDVKDIEGLPTYLETLQRHIRGEQPISSHKKSPPYF